MRVIGGSFKRRTIFGPDPDSMSLRPTHDRIRENVFNLLAPVVAGSRFLDLFAGCGCIGVEALSRGAERVVFVDVSPVGIALIRKNVELLGLQGATEIVRSDALEYLKRASGEFDIVYIDPPYDSGLAEEALMALGESGVLAADAVVLAEHKRLMDFERAGVLERTDARKYSRKTWVTVWRPREGKAD